MIIDSVSYKITYPLSTEWDMKVVRKELTSGFYRTWDYGLTSDVISSTVTVKGSYDELAVLMNYLKTNREISIQFEKEEDVFGPHVNTDNQIDTIVTDVEIPNRKNLNFWELTFKITCNNFSLYTLVPSIDDLWYTSSYTAGPIYNGEVTNQNSYGDVFNYYNHTVPSHSISFDLDRIKMAGACLYFLQEVRGDGFTLPADWESINPFGEEDYTHALLLNINLSKSSITQYRLTVNLQGYNNA